MSGVPIGIVVAVLLICVPIYKILTANYAPLKIRMLWLVLALGCIAVSLFMSHLQALEYRNATTDQERLSAMIGMGGTGNLIFIFGPLSVFLLLKPFIKSKYSAK